MEMLTRFLNRERFVSLRNSSAEGTMELAIKQTLLLDVARTCSEKIELTERRIVDILCAFNFFFRKGLSRIREFNSLDV